MRRGVLAVYQQSWNTGSGTGFSFSTGPFSEPVYALNFSNSGQHGIGIDNLTLEPVDAAPPVPAPGAALLAAIGVALVRSLRRRRAL